MKNFVLLLLIISCVITRNNALETQKGTIFGKETQYSIEYLG